VATAPAREGVLRVSAFVARVKNALERQFPAVWVRGELSSYKRWSSGHYYFSLKEGDAVVECFMFGSDAERLRFTPADGLEVEAFGSVTVYAARGRLQLTVREMRPAGIGALLAQLEALKKRLLAEGLFDADRKRPLPPFPRTVGLVTSPVGAAVRDVVTVLRRRWPSIGIVLAPVRVQGVGAADEIAAAIERFDRHGGVDVLIVGRGGGSIEDLWAFNEESVVRAIAAARVPVVSAVGHEVDTTLADLAADVRAATPSNAAELVVRERAEVARAVARRDDRAARAVVEGLGTRRRRVDAALLRHGFRRHADVLAQHVRRLDERWARMTAALQGEVRAWRERLAGLGRRHAARDPRRVIPAWRAALDRSSVRLAPAWRRGLADRARAVRALEDRLRALSPAHVMERGFCIVRGPDGSLVRAANTLTAGDHVAIAFARGEAGATIDDVRMEEEP